MPEKDQKVHPFISYLLSLEKKEDRAKLAALRRGLGKPPGAEVEMYRIVEPWMPKMRFEEHERAYYLTAALFAYHPDNTDDGNMGDHLRQSTKNEQKDALERRFTILLNSPAEQLYDTLRFAVAFLKSNNIPVNWNQLFFDIGNWAAENRKVQKSWARSFWARDIVENINEENTERT